jgi:hypothetical protein
VPVRVTAGPIRPNRWSDSHQTTLIRRRPRRLWWSESLHPSREHHTASGLWFVGENARGKKTALHACRISDSGTIFARRSFAQRSKKRIFQPENPHHTPLPKSFHPMSALARAAFERLVHQAGAEERTNMHPHQRRGTFFALAEGWHLTTADLLCCVLPIALFLSMVTAI